MNDDPTATLTAVIARLGSMVGERVTFRAVSGVKVTGVLSAFEIRQGDGRLWITFRDDPDGPIPVVGLTQQIEGEK